MSNKSEKIDLKILLVPLFFPVILWVVHLISLVFQIDFTRMGILPRNLTGLLGIITSPMVHGDFSHLISNTIPLVILGWIIFFFYPKVSY
ncbi:MAG: hypothetical protein WBQ32_05170, partial [Ignavibacteriaceae bacterium]